MKGELNLMVENKLEFLTRNIDNQTKRLKGNYEALTEALEVTNKELINNFKDKVVTIKAMVAAFFQRTEEQVNTNNEKSDQAAKMMQKF